MDFTDDDVTETVETDTDHFEVPPPEIAEPSDVEQYNLEFAKHNGVVPEPRHQNETESVVGKADGDDTESLGRNVKARADFPWLFDPSRGVRWDFDPIELRNLAQENTWVGMLVQSITKEIAETPWTIVEAEGQIETRKRLSTHPEERDPIAKAHGDAPAELPDKNAERIYRLLTRPNPDLTWHDMVEMWMADLLEIGSLATVKAFHRGAYDGDDLTADPRQIEPRALQVSAPEVWTKDYHERTGIVDGYWQFDDHRSPGRGSTSAPTSSARGAPQPDFFDSAELVWSDMSPRSNRRYGIPPTLLVKDFLQSIDLAVRQEQQYLSRGSMPSGAAVFEGWDREELKEWKVENEENIKGKPWKLLTIAGKGGGFSFEPFTYNFDEMQFTERMKWYARVVASAFQVPTAVVGIEPERVNYNTFQGERQNFESNTLGPYLQKLERIINHDIIMPHWGPDYRFEFKPGMSETTRQMITDRVTSQFSSGLIRRNEARQELGRSPVDDEFDGFQDEVVEDTSAEDAIDDIQLSKAEYEVGDETVTISPPDYMIAAAEAGQEAKDEYDDLGDCGTGVGDRRADQIINDEVGPDVIDEIAAYLTSHEEDVSRLDGNYTDWDEEQWTDGCGTVQYALWGGTGDGRALEWAQEKANEVAEARGEELPYQASAGDSGNGNLRKDEPLRNTDDWPMFTLQPEMVQDLTEQIAGDVSDVFDRVLDDDEVMSIIDRLAADETDKSLTELHRRLTEIFEDSDVVARIRRALRDETADAAREAIEDAIEQTDEDPDVDVEAIESQLRDREVEFADKFAEEMSEDIRQTVGDGWADGKGTREIAEEISEQAGINEGWTGAERIARQELHVATGHARSEFAADIGKVEIWNTSGDDRVRDAHEAMDGTWKRPGDSWVVDYSAEGRGVEKESVPGDSEPGIGCRCGVLLRDRDTVDADNYAGDGSL